MNKSPKKIHKPTLVFLTEFFPQNEDLVFTGGVEARTYYLCQQAKKDFKVKVIFSKSKKIAATPLSIFSRLIYLFSSFFKALKIDFDLIEASNTTTYLPAFLASKIKRKPVVAWFPDVLGKDWFQFGLLVGSFGFILEKISLKLNWDQVIALSRSTQNKLIKSNIPKQKITVAYGGIDLNEFITKKIKKYPNFTIITIARLVKTKRIIDLLKAFTIVNQKYPETNLIIIGQGPEKKQLKKYIKDNQLGSAVSIYPLLPREKMIKTLKKSHLFCLPSIVEGFGLVTIEALTANIPAVISDLPVHREITQNGRGVIFFKTQDYKDLSSKIFIMIKDQKIYQTKKKQAKKLITSYTWEKIYQQTKTSYLKAL